MARPPDRPSSLAAGSDDRVEARLLAIAADHIRRFGPERVTVVSVARDAGRPDGSGLPDGAVQMRNDYGYSGFGGAGPPPGDMPHRYFFVVHALDTERLDLGPDTTNAVVGFHLTAHAVARATLVSTYSH